MFHHRHHLCTAECTRHSVIYVGQSSQKFNSRFNGHISDVKVKPKACEVSQHFHNSKECSIDRDLNVYILQDVTGSWEKREYFKDRWITKLNSKAPNGMNSNLNSHTNLAIRLGVNVPPQTPFMHSRVHPI